MIRFENVLKRSLQDVLKTSWRRLQNVLNKSWRCLEDVLKMSWRRFCKTSWRRLEDVWPRRIYWSWPRRLEDVLKTYGQDEYIGLDQDVFWRRKAKANIFILIKKSWRRLEDVLKSSWRRMAKTNILVLTKTSSEDVWLRRICSSWSRRLEDVFWRRRRKTSSRRLHQDECLLVLF